MDSQYVLDFVKLSMVKLEMFEHLSNVLNIDQQEIVDAFDSFGKSGPPPAKKEPIVDKKETSVEPLILVSYSEKAFVVCGETKNFKELLLKLGGKYNAKLKCGQGWVFAVKNQEKILKTLKQQKVPFNEEFKTLASFEQKEPEPEKLVEQKKPEPEKLVEQKEPEAEKPVVEKKEVKNSSKKVEPKEEPFCVKVSDKTGLRIMSKFQEKGYVKKLQGSVFQIDPRAKAKVADVFEKHGANFEPVGESSPVEEEIEFSKNVWGSYHDEESGIVFEKRDGKFVAIGRQTDDEEDIYCLEKEDVEVCENNGWEYDSENVAEE